MKIKIHEKNRAAIQAALSEVNGRATAHTATARDVLHLSEFAEAKLASVAKKRRVGATAKLVSGGAVANAYKYQRTVTQVSIERGARDWYITAATTRTAWPNESGRAAVQLNYLQTLDTLAEFAGRGVGLTLTPPAAAVEGGAS